MTSLMGDAQGVGLAATQVGIAAARSSSSTWTGRARRRSSIPALVELSTEKETDEEGCLSLEGVRVPVERSTKVTLEGVDPERRAGATSSSRASPRGSSSTSSTISTAC